MSVALHRVHLISDGQWLDLEWTKGRGIASSVPGLPAGFGEVEIEAEPDAASLQGIPPICYRSDSPALFENLQLRENTDYFVDVSVPVSRPAAEAEMASQPGWPFSSRLSKVFNADPPRRWRTDDQGNLVVSGSIRLKNHAGILDLRTCFGNGLRVEVVCQKIGYLDEFRSLLDQVADEVAELLLQYDSPVSAAFNISDVTPDNEAGLLFQLRHIMSPAKLPASVDEILGQLHSRLYSHQSVVNLEEVEEPDIERLTSELDITSLQPGGSLRRFFGGFTPRTLPILEQFETTDTPENRYVKYFLEEVLLLSTRLRNRLAESGKQASAREAAAWIDQTENLLSRHVWQDIGPFRQFPSNSQVLQKGRGYRDILKYDLTLRIGLELPWKRAGELAEGIQGDLRPVNELYEYWCFFMLRRALAEACQKEEPSRGTLIQVSSDGLRISLRKGLRSKTSFLYREDTHSRVEVNLFYNRRFKRPTRPLPVWYGSYTANFDPDYSVEVFIRHAKGISRHWLHFDAKYRLDRTDVNSLFNQEPAPSSSDDETTEDAYETEIRRIHKQDDLFKMHTYRDGILSSRAAFILYPGDEEQLILEGKRQNLFVRHPSAFGSEPSFQIPSVGAISLSPGKLSVQQAHLATFLKELLEVLASATDYVEETGIFPV